MQAQHPSSSEAKATTEPRQLARRAFTPSRRQLATAVVGAALIGYLVHKTPDARIHLEDVAGFARTMGDLTEQDVAVVADLLAKDPCIKGKTA
ncbi:hypothetical protein [Pseudomonas frederiksbergensis]|uniref:hypothetical protein n=1 Tax=Pseudomonas frederiksbergensis TaxID=104087 RepID=UPI003D20327D